MRVHVLCNHMQPLDSADDFKKSCLIERSFLQKNECERITIEKKDSRLSIFSAFKKLLWQENASLQTAGPKTMLDVQVNTKLVASPFEPTYSTTTFIKISTSKYTPWNLYI